MPSLLAYNDVSGDIMMARKRTVSSRSSEQPVMKRRKTTGLNSRFDRMIETVNILHTSPASSKSSHSGRRRRAASSSSASAAEYDMPRTPVDAYNELHGGRLGADFAVIKMHAGGRERLDEPGISGEYRNSRRRSRKLPSIPAWLNNTLSTLDVHHPLRTLLPPHSTTVPVRPGVCVEPRVHEDAPVLNPAVPVEQAINDGSVFAFNPPSPGSPPTAHIPNPGAGNPSVTGRLASNFALSRDRIVGDIYSVSHTTSRLSSVSGGRPNLSEDLLPVPFSTPGPASSVGAVPPSDFPLESASRDDAEHTMLLEESIGVTKNGLFSKNPFAVILGPQADTPLLEDYDPDDFVMTSYGVRLAASSALAQNTSMAMLVASSTRSSGHTGCMPSATTTGLDRTLGGEVARSCSPFCLERMSSPAPQQPSKSSFGLERTNECTPLRPIPFYFDSPAEDPCSSDPLEEDDYMLPEDLTAIDFKWEKFDRGCIGETHTTSDLSSSDISASTAGLRVAPFLRESAGRVPRTPVLGEDTVQPSSSSDVPAPVPGDLQELSDDDDGTWIVPSTGLAQPGARHTVSGVRTASRDGAAKDTPRSPRLPVFAPAPGIFLSPLRKAAEIGSNVTPEKKPSVVLNTPGEEVADHDYRRTPPCEPAQGPASEQPLAETRHPATPARTAVEREARDHLRTSPSVRSRGRSSRFPAFASPAVKEVVKEDVRGQIGTAGTDGNHAYTPTCSQESHDTIESWTEHR
ncbi:uncharacterized protein B0H18DRAFT_1207171 [Fomitopsis serialis]|uniref:uncharacterized protein n=1 Tax=Fomitopsis serialis TaxID=139415 RepID=UPI0020084FB1|nr:uncharacterized protein B0H18DRAFT_1207171 [Neoantrodia serialis]KAH9935604.1 hypothetical protein B0H18DRAFT_1207171 [Neoantrodia serialis]